MFVIQAEPSQNQQNLHVENTQSTHNQSIKSKSTVIKLLSITDISDEPAAAHYILYTHNVCKPSRDL